MNDVSISIGFGSRDELLERLCQKVFGGSPVYPEAFGGLPANDPWQEARCEFCGERPLTEKEKAHINTPPADRPTPITDEPVSLREAADSPNGSISRIHQYDADACCQRIADLERQLAEVTEQRDQLERWKREQLAVDGSWDPQEVGRLLGMPLGADIRANIKPGIEKLMEQRDMLADLLRKSCAAHPVAGDWLEKSQEAVAAVGKFLPENAKEHPTT